MTRRPKSVAPRKHLPQFPEGRLPQSARVKIYKRTGRVNRRTIKCGICGKRRGNCVWEIFEKRLQIWTCPYCLLDFLPWFGIEEALEKIILERFAQNPAYSIVLKTKIEKENER